METLVKYKGKLFSPISLNLALELLKLNTCILLIAFFELFDKAGYCIVEFGSWIVGKRKFKECDGGVNWNTTGEIEYNNSRRQSQYLQISEVNFDSNNKVHILLIN